MASTSAEERPNADVGENDTLVWRHQATRACLLLEQDIANFKERVEQFAQFREDLSNKQQEINNQLRLKAGEFSQHVWSIAFINHPVLGSLLEEDEKDCLYHLVKLDVEEFEDTNKSGYKINLHFEENPYFENTLLTKEFQFESSGVPTSSSNPIQWKEGMDLTETRKEEKGQLNQKSFFAWYNDHLDPASDTIAKIIKDDIWNEPFKYLLGEDEEEEED